MDSSTTVTFKKRVPKGNLSVRRKTETETGDDDDEEANKVALSDIKLQQSVRQRKTGTTVDALSGHGAQSNSASSEARDGTKTIESVMGTQYTSQVDFGLTTNIPHKKLMDQYIDEKLGLAPGEKKPTQVARPDDELYRIPDNIKVLSEVEKKVDAADNGIVPAWSTQLAEVALPIKFKLKNIEETERASALDAARAEAGPKSIAAGYRFNSYERAPKVHPSAEGFLEEAEAGLAGPIAGVGAGAGGDVGNKRPLKSSDDRALDQYKKRQMNLRR